MLPLPPLTSAVDLERRGWIQSRSKSAVSARVGVEAGFGVGRSRQFLLESESE